MRTTYRPDFVFHQFLQYDEEKLSKIFETAWMGEDLLVLFQGRRGADALEASRQYRLYMTRKTD